jgi:hypothetical protein
MGVLMIGYDLHEGEDYKDLIDAIKAYGDWWHCLDSTWLIKTDLIPSQVRDNLRKHIKSDDRLIVLRYGASVAGEGGNGAWFGFKDIPPSQCSSWLVANL